VSVKNKLLSFTTTLLLGCSSGIPISITNQSGQALRDVSISGSGFHQHIESIPAGKTATLYVHPKGETGLALAFVLGTKKFSYAEDGYFEAKGYKVAVTVDPAGMASVRTDLAVLAP
jgi:hypothetical protein